MNKHFKFINTYAYKNHHEVFNYCIFKGLSELSKTITVYSSKSAWECLKQYDQAINVNYKKTLNVNRENKITYILRYFISGIENVKILIFSKKSDILVYTFENVVSFSFINKINKIFQRRIYIFCHGTLETLFNNTGGIGAKIIRYYCKKSFKNKKINDNIKVIVLGQNILDNLKKSQYPIDLRNFSYIDHPFIPKKIGQTENLLKAKYEIKIGMVGAFSKSKGSSEFSKLLQNIETEKLHFYIIGTILDKDFNSNYQNVTIIGNNNFLPREQFDEYVNNLDYILFLYPEDTYRFTASGAFFDSILFKKPIIALRNNYFEYMFNKYGKVGELFDSVEDIQVYLNSENFLSNEKKYDFSKYYDLLSVNNISSQLKKVFYEDL